MAPKCTNDERRAKEISTYEYKNRKDQSSLSWVIANANVPMTVYLSLAHGFALLGVIACIFTVQWKTLVFSGVLYFLSALGITAGVHRLYSHKSYKATLPYRCFMMVLTSLANQGTIHHWARDHRVHHTQCETEGDPHNAERGFFFSHMGWLLLKKDPRVIHAGRDIDMSDLEAMPEVAFQKRLDPVWNLVWCFVVPAVVAHFAWGETWWCGFVVPGALRYVVVLHLTWLVNSAAHCWGFRPYENTHHHGAWPSENGLVSLGAIGEGWHNWHHAYPFDYAASELGVSEQFNPTKLVIDAAAKLGLVSDRKRATKAWTNRKARLAREAAAEEEEEEEAAAKKEGGVEVEASSAASSSRIVSGAAKRAKGRLTLRTRRHGVPAMEAGAPCHLRESLTGVPLFKVRHIQTRRVDSFVMARLPS